MLSLLLQLDLAIVRDIIATEDLLGRPRAASAPGLTVGETAAGLLDACCRLVALMDSPADAPFLSALIHREIVYRALRSPQGALLIAMASGGDFSNRTARAIAWLKTHYAKPLHIQDLARVVGMGVSTLHHHFRAVTAMSPLQYQKQLRLFAARRRMFAGTLDATSAAYEVGYESVSQFNREYSRMFGQPPTRDIKSLRENGGRSLSQAFGQTG